MPMDHAGRAAAVSLLICLAAGHAAAQAPARRGPPPPGPIPHAKNGSDQPGNISGIWQPTRAPNVSGGPVAPGASPNGVPIGGEMRTMEGDPLPLQPWAAQIYATRRKEDAAGTPYAGTMARCLPHGMPGMAVNEPYPVQIIQSPGQVTMLHELMHSHRIILLDQPMPDDPDPSYMGTSVGHWEGDTLVVETAGIREETTMGSVPHSDALRTVERIRRLDPQTLEIVMTLEDPKAYTKPWRVRGLAKLQPDNARLIEYICDNQHFEVDAKGRTKLSKPAKRN